MPLPHTARSPLRAPGRGRSIAVCPFRQPPGAPLLPCRSASGLWPLLVFLLASVTAVGAPELRAQEEVTAVLRGEVLRSGHPLLDATVVLHRVTPGEAGEIDSVRVGAGGRFELALPHVPDPGSRSEIFFASVRHLDILYFGPPISDPVGLDSLYRIQVYDTLTAPPDGADITVSVRNLFIERTELGWQATDLFQLRNDSDRTYIAGALLEGEGGGERGGSGAPDGRAGGAEAPETWLPDGGAGPGGAVWSYPLPTGAHGFQIGQSDLPPDAAAFVGATMRTWAPLPPGERLYLVRYTMPDIETEIPMPGITEIMELLLLEPAPHLLVTGLRPEPSVEMEPGSTYRRFTGTDVNDRIITLTVTDEPGGLPLEWLVVVLAMILGVAGILAVKKRSGPVPAASPSSALDARSAILTEIALLDDGFSRTREPSLEDREAYRERREALKERLRALSGAE